MNVDGLHGDSFPRVLRFVFIDIRIGGIDDHCSDGSCLRFSSQNLLTFFFLASSFLVPTYSVRYVQIQLHIITLPSLGLTVGTVLFVMTPLPYSKRQVHSQNSQKVHLTVLLTVLSVY